MDLHFVNWCELTQQKFKNLLP